MDKLPDFDSQQLDYLHNTDFLLAKRKITAQLQRLLAASEQELVKLVQQEECTLLPENCHVIAGKISRGENYRGLPYLVLDYPRLFNKDDIFTFRTMCWWGNFFSCTLHLQGETLAAYRPSLKETLIAATLPADTFICTNTSPWDYHYQPDNYQLLTNLSPAYIHKLLEKNFLKISRKTGLDNYKSLPSFTRTCFRDFIRLLGH